MFGSQGCAQKGNRPVRLLELKTSCVHSFHTPLSLGLDWSGSLCEDLLWQLAYQQVRMQKLSSHDFTQQVLFEDFGASKHLTNILN